MSEKVDNEELRYFLSFGIGIHHNSLTDKDKKIVEGLFRRGQLRLLIAPVSFAWGKFLPAKFVVIKGTEYFDTKTNQYVPYPIQDMQQMMARAGRPYLDQEGLLMIYCEESRKEFLQNFVYSPVPIESSLPSVLLEVINAEVSSRNIRSFNGMMSFLHRSFLFIRVNQNPKYYMKNLDEIANEIVDKLIRYECVSINHEGKLKPTQLGRIAALYGVSPSIVHNFFEKTNDAMSIDLLLKSICNSADLSEVPIRFGEDKILSEMTPRYEYHEPLTSAAAKAFFILNYYFSNRRMPNQDFEADKAVILKQTLKIAKCFSEICCVKGLANETLNCLGIVQMINFGLWNDSNPLLVLTNEAFDFKYIHEVMFTKQRLPKILNELRNNFCLYKKTQILLDRTRTAIRIELEKVSGTTGSQIFNKNLENQNTMQALHVLVVGIKSGKLYCHDRVVCDKENLIVEMPSMSTIPKSDIWIYLIPEGMVGMDQMVPLVALDLDHLRRVTKESLHISKPPAPVKLGAPPRKPIQQKKNDEDIDFGVNELEFNEANVFEEVVKWEDRVFGKRKQQEEPVMSQFVGRKQQPPEQAMPEYTFDKNGRRRRVQQAEPVGDNYTIDRYGRRKRVQKEEPVQSGPHYRRREAIPDNMLKFSGFDSRMRHKQQPEEPVVNRDRRRNKFKFKQEPEIHKEEESFYEEEEIYVMEEDNQEPLEPEVDDLNIAAETDEKVEEKQIEAEQEKKEEVIEEKKEMVEEKKEETVEEQKDVVEEEKKADIKEMTETFEEKKEAAEEKKAEAVEEQKQGETVEENKEAVEEKKVEEVQEETNKENVEVKEEKKQNEIEEEEKEVTQEKETSNKSDSKEEIQDEQKVSEEKETEEIKEEKKESETKEEIKVEEKQNEEVKEEKPAEILPEKEEQVEEVKTETKLQEIVSTKENETEETESKAENQAPIEDKEEPVKAEISQEVTISKEEQKDLVEVTNEINEEEKVEIPKEEIVSKEPEEKVNIIETPAEDVKDETSKEETTLEETNIEAQAEEVKEETPEEKIELDEAPEEINDETSKEETKVEIQEEIKEENPEEVKEIEEVKEEEEEIEEEEIDIDLLTSLANQVAGMNALDEDSLSDFLDDDDEITKPKKSEKFETYDEFIQKQNLEIDSDLELPSKQIYETKIDSDDEILPAKKGQKLEIEDEIQKKEELPQQEIKKEEIESDDDILPPQPPKETKNDIIPQTNEETIEEIPLQTKNEPNEIQKIEEEKNEVKEELPSKTEVKEIPQTKEEEQKKESNEEMQKKETEFESDDDYNIDDDENIEDIYEDEQVKKPDVEEEKKKEDQPVLELKEVPSIQQISKEQNIPLEVETIDAKRKQESEYEEEEEYYYEEDEEEDYYEYYEEEEEIIEKTLKKDVQKQEEKEEKSPKLNIDNLKTEITKIKESHQKTLNMQNPRTSTLVVVNNDDDKNLVEEIPKKAVVVEIKNKPLEITLPVPPKKEEPPVKIDVQKPKDQILHQKPLKTQSKSEVAKSKKKRQQRPALLISHDPDDPNYDPLEFLKSLNSKLAADKPPKTASRRKHVDKPVEVLEDELIQKGKVRVRKQKVIIKLGSKAQLPLPEVAEKLHERRKRRSKFVTRSGQRIQRSRNVSHSQDQFEEEIEQNDEQIVNNVLEETKQPEEVKQQTTNIQTEEKQQQKQSKKKKDDKFAVWRPNNQEQTAKEQEEKSPPQKKKKDNKFAVYRPQQQKTEETPQKQEEKAQISEEKTQQKSEDVDEYNILISEAQWEDDTAEIYLSHFRRPYRTRPRGGKH
ncbi:Sec63 domain containing protein [Trichomonas vaginalis G3]|uniref:Sec63 domain containing protein n=1 Tax=Trichomonas vaginalis (strain ATCC PRA-98 / G3) TaxID=412133 RepID=A2DKI8_TRIV3|nr:Sec63 domain containing protein [Trichomonas vaginalis G3]|eukprot:XP_001580151.1 Sec63 domain containing protein [Trichomonas vaginalis G3]